MFNKILIANRGEIARRIMRTCREMGISTVVVYSDADKDGLFVREAEEAIAIGGNSAAESYLLQDKIIAAAKRSGADAIHPGFGFLSENASFAQRCTDEGIVFIGPSPEAIRCMGGKSESKALAAQSNVPLIPGYQGEAQDSETLYQEALKVGFPLLIKASAGGGGKGMRIVREEKELAAAVTSAQSEAQSSFGDAKLLIEKYFDDARHIEVQIMGDKHGNILHFFERECSLQRRFQKVTEEAPSPTLSAEQREKICETAVTLAKAIGYYNAGTVEMILAPDGSHYFLEMNTRLQVEHPVTEFITGLDLVRLQIEVAEGLPFSIKQEDICIKGHAVEARLYAEDARQDFRPAIGNILRYKESAVEGVRYDTGIDEGSKIDIFYDPMIAKVISYGKNRTEATAKLYRALSETATLGVTTNRYFLMQLLRNKAFVNNSFDTKFIERNLHELQTALVPNDDLIAESAVAAVLYRWKERDSKRSLLKNIPSGWRNIRYQWQNETYTAEEKEWNVSYEYLSNGTFNIKCNDNTYKATIEGFSKNEISLSIDGLRRNYAVGCEKNQYFVQANGMSDVKLLLQDRFPEIEAVKIPGSYNAPMPGQVVRVLVETGSEVLEGTPLLVLSSMKMENTIFANESGKIEEVYVEAGQFVEADAALIKLKV